MKRPLLFILLLSSATQFLKGQTFVPEAPNISPNLAFSSSFVTGDIHSASNNIINYYAAQFLEIPWNFSFDVIHGASVSADFDMDGDYDIAFVGKVDFEAGKSGILVNDGTGVYTYVSSFLPGGAMYSSIIGHDFDRDGDIDICAIGMVEWSEQLMIFENQDNIFTKVFETTGYSDIIQMAAQDMNNDGRPDLFFSHTTTNGINNLKTYQLLYQGPDEVFINSGIDFFPESEEYAGTFHLSDLNEDGFTDIIFSGIDNTKAQLFRNVNGRGFEKISTSLPRLINPFFGYLNGDSKVDLLNANQMLYAGMGNFQFGSPQEMQLEMGSISVRGADMNFDGWSDLVVTDGYFTALMDNTRNGNFAQSDYLFATNWGAAALLTDMENDGDIDLVKYGHDGNSNYSRNYFYKNLVANDSQNNPPSPPTALQAIRTEDGITFSWSPSTDDATPSELITYNLWLTDANGNSWMHSETNVAGTFRRILTQGNAGNRTSYTFNDLPAGEYTLKAQALDAAFALSPWSDHLDFTILEGPAGLSVERILLNKVLLQWTNGSAAEDQVLVLRKSHGADFEVIAELPAGSFNYQDEDLLYDNLYTYKVIEVVSGMPTASSNTADWNTTLLILQESELPHFSGAMDVGDYTGDGKMDLLVLGPNISALLENTETGWVEQATGSSTLPPTSSLVFHDINGDDKLDLYQYGSTSSGKTQTEIFQNNGDKTFTPATNVFTSNSYKVADWWDYDMDNDADAYVHNIVDSYTNNTMILKNEGSGNFPQTIVQCISCNPPQIITGDFDRDGDEDVITSAAANYQIKLNGPEGLKAGGTILINSYVSKGYAVDYNSDGWLDIFFQSYPSKLYKNKGLDSSGQLIFEAVTDDFYGGDTFSEWMDYDHDGDPDLFVTGEFLSLIYQNAGNDTFIKKRIATTGSVLSKPKWVDIDDDGDLDQVISLEMNTGQQYADRKVFYNQLIVEGKGIMNQSPQAPVNLSVDQDSTGMHLHWEASADDHTPTSGLTFDVILYRNGKAITKGLLNTATGSRLKLQKGREFTTLFLRHLTPGEYTWKVQAVDQNFRGSDLSMESNFIFRPLPPGIAGDTTVYRCGQQTVMITAKGENIEWFSDKDAAMKLASGAYYPEGSRVVYVTQTVDGIKGFAKRITITVKDRPEKPTIPHANPLPFCEYEAGYTGNVEARAEGYITWYASPNKIGRLGLGNTLDIRAENNKYYATQTLNGCESDVEIVGVEEVVIESTVNYDGGQLVTAEQEGNFYAWFLNEEEIPNSNNYFMEPEGEGSYIVGIVKGPCYEFSEPFLITATEIDIHAELKIFPNPVTDDFSIEVPAMNSGNLQILDVNGKIIYGKTLDNSTSQTITIPSAGWSNGIYFITMTNGQRKFFGKIVKL
jgi:hypothetical protein